MSVCGGDGYRLDALPELVTPVPVVSYSIDLYTLSLSLCEPVATGPCAGKNASVCLGAGVIAYWQPDVQPVVWRQENGGVRFSSSYNGDLCSSLFGSEAYASVVVDVLCDWTADVPHVGQVQNSSSNCNFNAQLFTRLVCLPPLGRAEVPLGLPVSPYANTVTLMDGCGAGLYDLSALDAVDLSFTSSGQRYWWRPCGRRAPAGTCFGNTTLCLDVHPNPRSNYSTGLASGPLYPSMGVTDALEDWRLPMYTLTLDGLLIQTKNGDFCNNTQQYWARSQVNVHLVCDPAVTRAAAFLNMTYSTAGGEQTGVDQCHYTLYIATAAVCPSQRLPSAPAPWTLLSAVAPPPAGTCAGAGFDVSASAVDLYAVDALAGTYALHACGNFSGGTYMLYRSGSPLATYVDTDYVRDYLRQPV